MNNNSHTSNLSFEYTVDRFGDDMLRIEHDKDKVPATVDVIAKDAKLQIESQKITGGKLLKINGRIPIVVVYVICHQVNHLYQVVAVFDPRLQSYCVVSSTNSKYELGSLISLETNEVIKPPIIKDYQTPSLFINYQDNLLLTKINGCIKVDGNQIILDVQTRLDELIAQEKLRGGSLLLINGRATVLSSYLIASKLQHLYGAIAVFDPKIGEKGLDRYVVAISHSPEWQVGDFIDQPNNSESNAKIVICGCVQTGKTVLRSGIRDALLRLEDAPDSYCPSGCPDGEGNWHDETYKNYPELAKKLKEEYKAKFTPEFALMKAKQIESIQVPILVYDVGGMLQDDGDLTPENQVIMAKATHAIIVYKNDQELQQWQTGCKKLDIPVVAMVKSNLNSGTDTIIKEINTKEINLFECIVHELKRGTDVSTRPVVQKLAQFLVNLVCI